MKKTETQKLLNKIKGYYNSQFFIDDYVIEAWTETMKPFELEDAIEHIKTYLKEFPDIAPKPQTFIKGLLTGEEKRRIKNSEYVVGCQLCGRWMPIEDYDPHFDKCLDIEYLVRVAKERGNDITRKDLESYPRATIEKLLKKYEPEQAEL